MENINIKNLYMNDIYEFSLLNELEEKENGKNIKLKNEIDIFYNKEDYRKIIDLGKVFVSLDNYNVKLVISMLEKIYKTKTSQIDKKIYFYIKKYKKLYLEKNRYLTIDELNSNFKDIIFKDFNCYEKLDSLYLIEQLKKYEKYINSFDTIYNSNLRLVVKFAGIFCNDNNILDLINYGNIILMKITDKFDFTKGKFSTYASYFLRRYMGQYAKQDSVPFHVSYEYACEVTNFNKKVQFIENSYGRQLSEVDIAELLNIPLNKVKEYKSYNQKTIYFEEKVDNDNCYKDVIIDKNDFFESVYKEELKSLIKQFYMCLTDKQLEVIKLRYGIDGNPLLFEEISKIVGVTHQRCCQIHVNALNKMRKELVKKEKLKSLKYYR